MLEWFVYAAMGKLLIYLWQLFPLPMSVNEQKTYIAQFIYKLHQCDLCSGVWLYCALALIFGINIIQADGFIARIAGELITGAITSFAVHIFSIGWRSKYEVITF
jgi:hypothetical protein